LAKPIDKEFEIISQVTLIVKPSLRLERMRLGEDFWISGDGPDVVSIRSWYLEA